MATATVVVLGALPPPTVTNITNKLSFPTSLPHLHRRRRLATLQLSVASPSSSSSSSSSTAAADKEVVFFDGGAHYGDLVANLLLGYTLLWLPLTLAAVSRAFFLRYRFTNLRATVVSGFSGQDRSDFAYNSITDVKVVPRFIGEWGDIVVTLKDGTKVDLRSVPKFREIAEYCISMSGSNAKIVEEKTGPRGF